MILRQVEPYYVLIFAFGFRGKFNLLISVGRVARNKNSFEVSSNYAQWFWRTNIFSSFFPT